MAGVRARVSTARIDYFQLNVNNLDVHVASRPSLTDVELILSSISVQDLQANAPYTNLVSLKEDTANLVSVRLSMVNAPKGESTSDVADVLQREKFYFRNYLDAEHFDLVVKANISKLRFMFLMRHLNTLLVSVIFVMAGNHAFT